jgi:collagenase-like PrtC family protease
MLKITSPFRETKEVLPLIEAGADELYCGYLSPGWAKSYTSLEFERKGGGSNFSNLTQLKQAVDLAHKNNTPVYLALNGLYVKQQYPLLMKIVRQLEKIDLDGYIVADIGLLLSLRKAGSKKQIHISTGGTVFNSRAAHFYKNLGACRIVLDRQTTLSSIKILSNEMPDMDFEVFILNTLCVYIDGFCTFLHTYGRTVEDISKKDWKDDEKLQIITAYDIREEMDACCLNYSVQAYKNGTKRGRDVAHIRPIFYKQISDGVECGACAIYDINKTGVKSVKIVGRQLTPEMRLKSTQFIRQALDILEGNKDINKQEFIQRVQILYQKAFEYKKHCKGNNCFHPGLIYGKSNICYKN